MSDVTVCIFQHRLGPIHARQMESLAKHTLRSFDLVYVFEPGTAAQNINKCFDRAKTRYVAICDDDVIFLEDHWLDKLLSVLQDYPSVGVVTPSEIKTRGSFEVEFEMFFELFLGSGRDAFPSKGTRATTWNAGYVMLFDMQRVSVRADEHIPGKSGMSDVDLCFQVRNSEHYCAVTDRTMVYHPTKLDDYAWREQYDMYHEYELAGLSAEQCAYMRTKWGSFFDDSMPHKVLSRLGE